MAYPVPRGDGVGGGAREDRHAPLEALRRARPPRGGGAARAAGRAREARSRRPLPPRGEAVPAAGRAGSSAPITGKSINNEYALFHKKGHLNKIKLFLFRVFFSKYFTKIIRLYLTLIPAKGINKDK